MYLELLVLASLIVFFHSTLNNWYTNIKIFVGSLFFGIAMFGIYLLTDLAVLGRVAIYSLLFFSTFLLRMVFFKIYCKLVHSKRHIKTQYRVFVDNDIGIWSRGAIDHNDLNISKDLKSRFDRWIQEHFMTDGYIDDWERWFEEGKILAEDLQTELGDDCIVVYDE